MLFNRLKFSNVGVLTAKVRFETSQVLTWSKPIKKPFFVKNTVISQFIFSHKNMSKNGRRRTKLKMTAITNGIHSI